MSASTTFGRYQVIGTTETADGASQTYDGHDPLMARGVTIRVLGPAPERDFGAVRPADDTVLGPVLDWGTHAGVAFAVFPARAGAASAPMTVPEHATQFAATASQPSLKAAGVSRDRRRDISTWSLVVLITIGLAVTGFLGLWGFWILGLIALAAVLFVASGVGLGLSAVGITFLTVEAMRIVRTKGVTQN